MMDRKKSDIDSFGPDSLGPLSFDLLLENNTFFIGDQPANLHTPLNRPFCCWPNSRPKNNLQKSTHPIHGFPSPILFLCDHICTITHSTENATKTSLVKASIFPLLLYEPGELKLFLDCQFDIIFNIIIIYLIFNNNI